MECKVTSSARLKRFDCTVASPLIVRVNRGAGGPWRHRPGTLAFAGLVNAPADSRNPKHCGSPGASGEGLNRTALVQRRRAGFSLVELLIAMGLGFVALGAVSVFWIYASKTCAAVLNYVDLADKSKMALDQMSMEIRNARSLTSLKSDEVVFQDQDAQEMRYTYNSTNKTMTQTKAGRQKVLLTGCDFFQITGYQRFLTNGTFALSSTTNTPLCKLLQVNWLCSRELAGSKKNSERQVSAKIVIRNQ
jgi:hypothetical protein